MIERSCRGQNVTKLRRQPVLYLVSQHGGAFQDCEFAVEGKKAQRFSGTLCMSGNAWLEIPYQTNDSMHLLAYAAMLLSQLSHARHVPLSKLCLSRLRRFREAHECFGERGWGQRHGEAENTSRMHDARWEEEPRWKANETNFSLKARIAVEDRFPIQVRLYLKHSLLSREDATRRPSHHAAHPPRVQCRHCASHCNLSSGVKITAPYRVGAGRRCPLYKLCFEWIVVPFIVKNNISSLLNAVKVASCRSSHASCPNHHRLHRVSPKLILLTSTTNKRSLFIMILHPLLPPHTIIT